MKSIGLFQRKSAMKKYIRELINDRIEVDESIGDAKELYERLNFDSSMDEIIEHNLDTRTDLEKWAVKHELWIEDSLKDFPADMNYHDKILNAQWLAIKQKVQWTVGDVYEELDGVAFNMEVA